MFFFAIILPHDLHIWCRNCQVPHRLVYHARQCHYNQCSPTMHYSDVIASSMASQITGVSIVCPTVCSGANQRKHKSSASLPFARGNPPLRASSAEHVSIWWHKSSWPVPWSIMFKQFSSRYRYNWILMRQRIFVPKSSQSIFQCLLSTHVSNVRFMVYSEILSSDYGKDVCNSGIYWTYKHFKIS